MLLMIVAVLILIVSNRPDQNEVVVPTAPPTEIVQPASDTPSPSPSPTLQPPTATVTQTAQPTSSPEPTSTPAPTDMPETPAPALPPVPAPVEIALGVTLYEVGGVTPSYGRFGGLYDNEALIEAGHVMITVPGEGDFPTFHIDAF
jgi:hypothetical protein